MTSAKRRSLLAAGLAACVQPAAGRAQSPAPISITDAAGRRITLPGPARRIYAAGPPASILVFAVAPDNLIGWTSAWRAAERPFIAQRYADLPTLGRLTGRGSTANVEVVLQAKPDVIVDYGAVGPTYVSLAERVQAQTGIPYLLLDGDFERMAEAVVLMGRMAGEPERADSLARYIRDTLSNFDRRLAGVPTTRRPRIYYGRGPDGLVTGLAGSINAEFIERVGAVNAAAELGRGGLVRVSIEQVLRWDPDVIVTIDPNFRAMAPAHPLWRGMRALREGRFYLAPALPFGWIDFPPSLNRVIGLRWLGAILYPDAFPEDLRPIVRDFYLRCYHQAPTQAQLDQLLGTAGRP